MGDFDGRERLLYGADENSTQGIVEVNETFTAMNWFKRKTKQTTTMKLEAFPMTVAEFRSSVDRRNIANRVFQMPEFQAMYGALVVDRPSKTISFGLPPHVNSAHAMYSKGYEDCLTNLLLLGIDPKAVKQEPMTFLEENEDLN